MIAKQAAPGGTQPTSARFSADGKRIAVGFNETTAVNLLDPWLADRVKQLTGNQQTPTTTKPNTVPDFPVAVVR